MTMNPSSNKVTLAKSRSIGRFFKERTLSQRLEIISAIILALATVASAWCAYQSSSWSSAERKLINESSILRSQANQKNTAAMQYLVIDVNMFLKYAQAYSQGDQALMNFIYDRFQPEMKTAVTAWVALNPLSNESAPPTPFAMDEYKLPLRTQADELLVQAEDKLSEAMVASGYSSNYALMTVIFASVLFFAGVISKFKSVKIQMVLMGFAIVTFLAGIIVMILVPISL